MLEIRNTRQAVFSPGSDSDYFDQLTLADVPLQDTDRFDQKNAWWLAELSRLIYTAGRSSRTTWFCRIA